MSTIEELQKQLKEQAAQIDSLREINKSLTYKYTQAHKKTIQYDRVRTRINLCVDRILFCVSFLQYLGQTSCVYGSLIRKWMECTLQFNKMESKNKIGDVSHSDINILLNANQSVNKIHTTAQFYQLLHHINTTRICSEQIHSGIQPPQFYKYKLIGIQHVAFVSDEGETVPKVRCYFKYGSDFLKVEMLAWRTKEIVDFTVNNYILTINGLHSVFDQSFFQYIEHIHFHQTRYIQPIDLIQKNAFPLHATLSRKDKLHYLTSLYRLISHCYLKMYGSDYKLIQYLCVYIEQKEECSITGCKPPYPVLSLECGHSLSLMAYKGILFMTSDADTQSIRCPLCRTDLKIKFKPQVIERNLTYTPISAAFMNNSPIVFEGNMMYPFITKESSENL